MELILLLVVTIFVIVYRVNPGEGAYKFITNQVSTIYNKYAPYSFKSVTEKVQKLGLSYSARQYTIQLVLISGAGFVISYLYFYNIVISIIYTIVAIMAIPYLAFLRYKRIYSEFLFEQIQIYTTNTIMEYQTTLSFVSALEGVYSSGVLEDPVKSDVKMMIDIAYEKGDIIESIEYMNSKYDFHIVKNMHQFFLQVTREGAHDIKGPLDNMLLDIDMLVESVYRDRMDRASFHTTFLRYGVMLYFTVMLVQYLLGIDTYLVILNKWTTQLLLHAVILSNSYFLMSGEKYYNENVGAE